MKLIQNFSGGIPRLINRVCSQSLIYAYQSRRNKVRLDIRPGDLCLVFFCDVNTDGWEGGNGGNGAARHHDLADGFAFVGFHTQGRLE